MELKQLIEQVREALQTTAFRFKNDVGYGIDYKINKYFFLDEIGALIIQNIIEQGSVCAESIAKDYGVPPSLIIEDANLFLRQFIETNSPNCVPDEYCRDELFLSYFAERKIPISASIEVTEACNEHCIHCYRPTPKKEVWNAELFTQTCAELRELGCLQIDFTGGEPFLKKGFLDFLKIADQHGFIVSILTNATLISDEAIVTLRKIKLRNIYVSLYSDNAVIHDKITQLPGSFHTTVATIEKLVASNISVVINAPIMKANKESPSGIKALANRMGLEVKFAYKITASYNKSVSTEGINVYSKQELSKQINDPQVQLYSDLIALRKAGGTTKRDRIRTCDAGFRSITISPEGEIIPCTALRLKCGNITKDKISSLWVEDKNMQHWRNEGSLVKDGCMSCSSYDFCEPCPAGYFAEHNSLDGIDNTTCGFGKVFNSCVTCV
jgi:radical SAM protein with 4Fe4S-binding SPASM domain